LNQSFLPQPSISFPSYLSISVHRTTFPTPPVIHNPQTRTSIIDRIFLFYKDLIRKDFPFYLFGVILIFAHPSVSFYDFSFDFLAQGTFSDVDFFGFW